MRRILRWALMAVGGIVVLALFGYTLLGYQVDEAAASDCHEEVVTPTPVVGYARSAPANIGDALELDVETSTGNFTERVTPLEVVAGEAAWQMVEQANMFNDPPEEGFEYILVKIRFEVLDGAADRQDDLYPSLFTIVSTEGKDYDDASVSGLDPELRARLYPGASHEGWAAFYIREDDPAPLLTYARDYDGSGGVWWKLRE